MTNVAICAVMYRSFDSVVLLDDAAVRLKRERGLSTTESQPS
jgi:hypothetical protein